MLGSTLTVTMDGSGGTAKTLPNIGPGTIPQSSVYFLDEGLVTYRADVRHTSDNVKLGTQPYDRHTVTFTRFVKPTAAIPLGSSTQIIYTIRTDPNGVVADVVDLSEAMSFYMVKAGGIATKLLGLES
ncbi:TPA_asm: coat protein [ssRNA phage Zoerhiza.1_20]|uniref:Coat protein n=2 Tax=Leviviricetes TaxID=2842243 RepID=A0A8S5L095_9VIRU|nr:coat protein [ssRNA phage Zoerhiza.1_20]QDH88600.1 MAG: hypothetical protein H1Rhizo25951_000002 [Leviviridae sp.]DAD50546.1 TPA_asm: coat protein [ssRNA phage Zoerhiza.1_20]